MNSDMGHLRRNLLQQLQPFGTDAVFEDSKAGGVATGPCQAGDQASAYWVNDTHEHDRHSTGFPLQFSRNRGRDGQDGVGRECDQFRGVLAKAVRVAASPAVIHPHVAADAPAQFLKALLERGDAGLSFLIVREEVHLNPDAPHPLRLLRARRQRPRRCRTAEQRYELAPDHSITSSARASSVGETSSPSAFAVLRLMTSSNLVACSTGRSAALVPLRILPV